MVFGLGLGIVTVVCPGAAVVTVPMATGAATGGVGSVAGAVVTATASAAATSAAATATTVAGITSATTAAGYMAGTTAGITGGLLTSVSAAMGPPGWIMLGASEDPCSSEYNWTCWKKIIHDDSDNNNGVPLSYIFNHSNVKAVFNHVNHLVVKNIWDEKFNIYYVQLPNGDIAAHAE